MDFFKILLFGESVPFILAVGESWLRSGLVWPPIFAIQGDIHREDRENQERTFPRVTKEIILDTEASPKATDLMNQYLGINQIL